MEIKLASEPQFNMIDKQPEKGLLKRLAGLASGVLIFWVFAIYFIPWLTAISFIHPLISYIEEYDIKATAIYYTDIEEFAKADHMVQQLMTYPIKKVEE